MRNGEKIRLSKNNKKEFLFRVGEWEEREVNGGK